jgi:hypothetical protein
VTHLALKEWSAVVHALLDGRQTILLRKGGIREKRFEVAAQRFLLFPTVAHSHTARVRREHRELLAPAEDDGGAERVVIRAGAKVVAAVQVSNPAGLTDIEDLHIWTDRSVREDRLDFRPKHMLTVLVVAACPLTDPVTVTRTDDYAGCTSWVNLPVAPDWGRPVHDDAALNRVADEVRRAVGGAQNL